jgi:hypothetical protein
MVLGSIPADVVASALRLDVKVVEAHTCVERLNLFVAPCCRTLCAEGHADRALGEPQMLAHFDLVALCVASPAFAEVGKSTIRLRSILRRHLLRLVVGLFSAVALHIRKEHREDGSEGKKMANGTKGEEQLKKVAEILLLVHERQHY